MKRLIGEILGSIIVLMLMLTGWLALSIVVTAPMLWVLWIIGVF